MLTRIMALIAVTALLLGGCAGGSEDDQSDAALEQEEETDSDEVEEEEAEVEESPSPEEEEKYRPPKVKCNPKDQGRATRPSRDRVLKGDIRALDRKYCAAGGGAITLVRLPPEQGDTIISLEIGNLADGTYVVFAHTGACKDGGGPRYLRNRNKPPRRNNQLGGSFKMEGGAIRNPEVRAKGIAGKEVVSAVIYSKGKPVACADLQGIG